MDISKIQSAFYPSTEISEPAFFVGRKNEIQNLITALGEAGSCIAIHGLRGVGKSSIARQLTRIASGDRTLIELFKLQRSVPQRGYDFIVISVTCDAYTNNVMDVLKRIVFGDNGTSGLFEHTAAGDKRVESIKSTFRASGSVGLFGAKIEGGGQDEVTYTTVLSDNLMQQFKQLLGTVQKDNQGKTGLLIVIDEFDVLEDKAGMGSVIKTCSSNYVKFAISGIASTVTNLVEDHSSIARQLHPVLISKMPTEELHIILKRAEHHIGNRICFNDDAAELIVSSAEGFPYFVHLIGKQALLEAFQNDKARIEYSDIIKVKNDISSGRLKTVYEETYHSAVKESPQRELLLKLFSEEATDEMNTEGVYTAAKDLGVTNPSQLMRELTQPQDGSLPVLTKLRPHHYRFTDPVFKVYAKLRTWKYE